MSRDLAKIHYPVTGLFDRGAGAPSSKLSEEQIASFHRNGFLSGIRVLSVRQIAALRSAVDELMYASMAQDGRFYEYHHNESADPDKILFHALGAWRISPAFHDLLFHKAVVVPASQLLGGPVRFWHDQLFVKPANDGGVVAWHQDYSYWTRTKPMAHLTCWIGLDEANEENGCVQYVPGSHRWNLLPRNNLANDMEAVFGLLDNEQKRSFRPFANVLRAGEASFHHPLTLHGSYENRSQSPRRAAVINFVRDGVQSDSDEPLLAGIPPVPKGEPIGGQFFPLLWPRNT